MSNEMTRRSALTRFAAAGASTVMGGGFLAACGSSSQASSGPIKVGVLTDLTGAFGIVGKANAATAKFAAHEINASGGVMGRKLQLVIVDGASSPATNANAATQLVTSNQVDVVIGGVTSAERLAVKDIIAKRGRTLYLWPASYEGGECDDNVWSVGAVPNEQVNPTVDYLLSKGAKTFYLCGNDYSYPQKVLGAARARIEAGGGKILGEDYIPISATDAPQLVSRTLALKPDALFEVVILPATVPFIKGVIDGGFKGVIAGTLFDQTINPLLGKYAQNLIGVQDYFPTISDPFSQQEVAKFQRAYPNVPFGSVLNSPAWYRAFYFYKVAVEKARSTDVTKVDQAMNSVSYERLIGGPAKMVPGTRHCEMTMYLGEMQGSGSVKTLKDLGEIAPTGQC